MHMARYKTFIETEINRQIKNMHITKNIYIHKMKYNKIE